MPMKPDRRSARRSQSTAPLGVVAAALLLLGACAPATPTKPVEKDGNAAEKAPEKDATPPVKADEPPPQPNTDPPQPNTDPPQPPPPPDPPQPDYPPPT